MHPSQSQMTDYKTLMGSTGQENTISNKALNPFRLDEINSQMPLQQAEDKKIYVEDDCESK